MTPNLYTICAGNGAHLEPEGTRRHPRRSSVRAGACAFAANWAPDWRPSRAAALVAVAAMPSEKAKAARGASLKLTDINIGDFSGV